jgi:hypothetical protein
MVYRPILAMRQFHLAVFIDNMPITVITVQVIVSDQTHEIILLVYHFCGKLMLCDRIVKVISF